MNEQVSDKSHAIREIKKWPDEKLIQELRSPIRATMAPTDVYTLLLVEAVARILERG